LKTYRDFFHGNDLVPKRDVLPVVLVHNMDFLPMLRLIQGNCKKSPPAGMATNQLFSAHRNFPPLCSCALPVHKTLLPLKAKINPYQTSSIPPLELKKNFSVLFEI